MDDYDWAVVQAEKDKVRDVKKQLDAAIALLQDTVCEPDIPYAMGAAWIASRDTAIQKAQGE